ncbi:MAG TPA: hypothetical protein VGN09_25050 [Vicinamibacteria bacterium]|jgi:hypothetical protein
MEKLRLTSRVALFVSAMVFSFQISPARAAEGDQGGRVEVTFTKWVLNGLGSPTPLLMRGVTGGEIEGVFIGETFVNVAKTNPDLPALSNLEVIYGVQADDPERSFTALIRGGAALGKAQLDGRILAGWRIGALVHVEWVRFPSTSADCPSPPPFAGAGCFVGTMTIERAKD